MRYKITHTTTYHYSESVGSCHNEARLIPSNTELQSCSSASISVDPQVSDYRERSDFFGNKVAYFSIHIPHTELRVTAQSEVQTSAPIYDISKQNTSPEWEGVAATLLEAQDNIILDAQQYCYDSPMIIANSDMAEYARPSFAKNCAILDAVSDLVKRIHHDFTYDPQFTTIATPLNEVLKHRRGVCQDFAHFGIACLRSLGLAARYVSGYIETQPPAGQARMVGADASHAWFSVYVPEMGWVDFDPTNNQIPGDKHIMLAVGRDYQDVTPLKGVIFGGGKHKLDVAVDVEQVVDNQ